jgi:hypothetical protein
MEDEKAKQEFKSAEELHRFEAGMMLGQTAVYLVATGALLNGIQAEGVKTFSRIVTALLGLLLSLSFLLITQRCGLNLRGARRRAEELGRQLGYKLYMPEYRAPSNKLLVGKNVTQTICVCGSVLWLVLLSRLLIGQW